MSRVGLALLPFAALSCVMSISVGSGSAARDDKVAVCHHPPGNPDNRHLIIVSPEAVASHLEHGDHKHFDGSLFSAPVMELAVGASGNALIFDGIDSRMQIDHSSSLAFSTGTITATMWIKPDVGSGGWRTLLSKGSDWPLPLYLHLLDNQVRLVLGGPLDSAWMPGVTVTPGEWTHLAMIYDGSAFKLFTNGVLQAELVVFPEPLLLSVNSDPLYVGYNSLWPVEVFDGLIDELHLFDRALSDQEVAELFAGRELGSEVALFSFDYIDYFPTPELAGLQRIVDHSGYQNHGSLNPSALECNAAPTTAPAR